MPDIATEFGASAGKKFAFTQDELDEMVEEAVSKDSAPLLRLALAAGGSPDGVKGDLPPLISATENGKPELMKLLLDAGASTELSARRNGGTPLIQAVIFHNYEGLALLIEKQAKLDGQDNRQRTALLVAAGLLDDKAVEMLVLAGASPAIPDKDGTTPLAEAKKRQESGILTDSGLEDIARIISLIKAAPSTPQKKPVARAGMTP